MNARLAFCRRLEVLNTFRVCWAQTLPITRVKKIIKQDGEVKAISNDANYAIAKAAVRFGVPAGCLNSEWGSGSRHLQVGAQLWDRGRCSGRRNRSALTQALPIAGNAARGSGGSLVAKDAARQSHSIVLCRRRYDMLFGRRLLPA